MIQPVVLLLLVLSFFAGADARADVHADNSLSIAVASNFRSTAEDVARAFTVETGVPIRLSSGSTGKLYAQVVNGAPYDIFLAADMKRPRLLSESGRGVEDSLQAYVAGQLVLMSADSSIGEDDCLKTLREGSYRKLAIANPATAPYGAAAKAWLQAAGLWGDAESRIIMGENISQTFQFVATRNATLGIVSASQLAIAHRLINPSCHSAIDVPKDHAIQQGGIILHRTNMPAEARLFMSFLRSNTATELMIAQGYEVPRL